MEAIRQTFFQECEEQLAELESGLLALQNGASDRETVDAVFRAVHSVKGGAGAFGLDHLVRFAHVFETALDALRSDRLCPTPDVLKVMLRSADVLADLVRGARGGDGPDDARVAGAAAELATLTETDRPLPAASALAEPAVAPADDDGFAGLDFKPVQVGVADLPGWVVRFRPLPAMYAKANDAGLLLRELSLLGSAVVTLDASDLPGSAGPRSGRRLPALARGAANHAAAIGDRRGVRVRRGRLRHRDRPGRTGACPAGAAATVRRHGADP